MIHNGNLNTILLNAIPLNDYKKVCGSCTLYIVLFAVFLVTTTVISTVFVSFYWYSKKILPVPTNINDNFRKNKSKLFLLFFLIISKVLIQIS